VPIPEPADGQIVAAVTHISIDPAIRGFLDDRESYLPPVAIGDTVRGMTLGRILRSRDSAYAPGRFVRALAGWEDLSVLGSRALGLEFVDAAPETPLQFYMGALGPSGLTAWIGLNEIGRIKAGQTVLVSAAAGAVGSVAGQVARLQGCRVIGLAGSAAKVAHLKALGFHSAIDHHAEADLSAAIRAACPEGVDVYFDNVGGAMMSDYNRQDHPQPVRTLWHLVVKRLTMRGFLTYEHADRIPTAQAELTQWIRSGELKVLDNLHAGIESAPAAFIELMSGQTVGKTLVSLVEFAV